MVSACNLKNIVKKAKQNVLILILLEDGFCSLKGNSSKNYTYDVLILILLEDGFCYEYECNDSKEDTGLNPYSIGRWFLLTSSKVITLKTTCLNPYSIGRWFLLFN